MKADRYLELDAWQRRIAARGSVRSDEVNTLVSRLREALDALAGEDEPRGGPGLRFVLPYPPSTNHLWENARRFAKANEKGERKVYMGRKLSDAAETFKQRVIAVVRDGGRPTVPLGRLRLRFVLYPPDARLRDADNGIKLAQDAIAAGLGIDDYRISAVEVRRRLPVPHNPRVEVAVEADDWTPFSKTGECQCSQHRS